MVSGFGVLDSNQKAFKREPGSKKDTKMSWHEYRTLIWKQSAGDQPHEGVPCLLLIYGPSTIGKELWGTLYRRPIRNAIGKCSRFCFGARAPGFGPQVRITA